MLFHFFYPLWVPAAMAVALFEDDSVLTLVLQGPWSKNQGDNDKNSAYLPYKLTVDGTNVSRRRAIKYIEKFYQRMGKKVSHHYTGAAGASIFP